uniref:Uncharacterized protein n=1 Tax=viral metagenome TaxID=1070528 RepID=A0A6M3IGP0_9ZZZZ
MIFTGKDGEIRISDKGLSGTTHYLTILFSEMDFTGPTSRPRIEDTLIMDRGVFDSNAHYISGNDEPRYAPLPISFSCRMADTTKAKIAMDLISGVTLVGGVTQLYTMKGTTSIDGNTLPAFKDALGKYAYQTEVLWDGTSDLGIRYSETYYPPGQQTITESADGLILSCNAVVYGDVTRIQAFDTRTTTTLV